MDSLSRNITENKSPLAVIYGDPTEYQFRFLLFAFWYRLPWLTSITLKMEAAFFSEKPVSMYDPKRSLRSLLCLFFYLPFDIVYLDLPPSLWRWKQHFSPKSQCHCTILNGA